LAGESGLTLDQVRDRVDAGQVNAQPPAAGRTLTQIFRANILTRFNAILGVLFVLVLIVGPPQDAVFGVVLVVNTGIGITQELRAKRALDRLAILTASKARVRRDGAVAEIAPGAVVQDDLLDLRRGDQVPADAVVTAADGLELDEALLTGEADPVRKGPDDTVMSGSFVVAGTGLARVAAVGEESYAIRLQAHARQFTAIRSELQQGTNQILRLVTWVMVPAGILLIVSEFFRSHRAFEDAVRGSAAGVSAMVPEGLVLLTSIAFAAGALRLARRKVLVAELPAIEGLARVDMLCIDKTGTLTRPGMRLIGTDTLDGQHPAGVRRAIAAVVSADEDQNATVKAIAAGYPHDPGWTVTRKIPFSSARKWSGVEFAGHGSWVLGAPEIVGGGDLPDDVRESVARHEAAGRRVLLLAISDAPLSVDDDRLPAATRPAALLVLAEELRDETAAAVRYLRGQGVRIKVLSGDAPRAVAAIADRAGITERDAGPPQDAAVLTDDEIGDVIGKADIFGRVRPAQKLRAVQALQSQGHVVAMVGDGVNDVQALKQADLGIAMGSGSDASRSVARVVLLDGTFAAIPQLLGEARRVIGNIERVAGLFITKTVYAAIIAVAIGVAGVAYPFFPRHLTVVAALTIGVPGFFLALAPGAPRARPGFTRRTLNFAIPAGTAAAIAALAGYAIARHTAGVSDEAARTAAMLALLAVGLWVLAIAGGPPLLRIALVAAMAACVVPLLAIPLARRVFEVQLPPANVLLYTAASTAAAIIALTVYRGSFGKKSF
jgi:cation-transporting P-type ATPase E